MIKMRRNNIVPVTNVNPDKPDAIIRFGGMN